MTTETGPGQPITILITAEPSHRYVLHPGLPFLTATLPGPPAFSLDVPLSNPGVTVIPGDVRETLAQMAVDAIEFRDCASDEECAVLRERYRAVLAALPTAKSGTEEEG